MKKTVEERMKERLTKLIGKKLCECGWFWHGVQFTTFGWLGIKGFEAFVRFSAKPHTLTVNIETEEQYGIADKEKTFTSENALGEAVEWTADILIDLYQTIEQRTKPYQKGHEDYLRAVKGT